ncbi:hypothetical protein [Aureimonas pseudogalii]|uniref:Uncharacterized protein n=1 Tax=Aureimonas pseudogalii TaxID=1744844 RepID=A0A7W6H2T0_9HYPH|nr:hypothetical protein [Aureimonas pseudogalii]MBB3996995.1 hypothetical protein [Aureimonas pseudogalii]
MIDDHEPLMAPSSLDHVEWVAYLRLIRSELATLSPVAAQCIEWAEDILRREDAAGTRLLPVTSAVALRQ